MDQSTFGPFWTYFCVYFNYFNSPAVIGSGLLRFRADRHNSTFYQRAEMLFFQVCVWLACIKFHYVHKILNHDSGSTANKRITQEI